MIGTLNPTKKMLIEANLEAEKVYQEVLKSEASKSLFKFNKFVLKADKGDDKFVPLGEFQKDMCNFVQDDKTRKKLLLIPRNHLKTKLITIGYTTYLISQNPKIRILIYSATNQMAVDMLSQVQRNISSQEVFVSLYGDKSQGAKEWPSDRIRLAESDTREPTVTAAGIDNNLVGGHYDVIIFDDVVNRDNVGTSDQIVKVIQRYNDSLDLLEPGGQIIVIGTRWHDSDLYGWILSPENLVSKDYDFMVKRAYEGDLATGEGFSLLWEGKFTREELKKRQESEGWSHFSAQYLNDPVPDIDATFPRDKFIYYEPQDFKGTLMSNFLTVDPALSQATYADYTAMVVAGVDEWKNIFIKDITRAKMLPNEIINEIFRLVKEYNINNVAIETVAYQKTLAYTLREEMRLRGVYFHISEVKPNQRSKEERIKALQPLYENGKIFHNKYLVNNYNLEDELTRFPKGSHDDVIDALSYLLDIIYPAREKTPSSLPRGRKYLY